MKGSRGSQAGAGRLRGREAIARRVGGAVARLKVFKRFEIRCRDDGLSWSRWQERIDRGAALDGIRVVSTSPGTGSIGPDGAVEACKALARVEKAFRQIRTGAPEVRPIFVHSERRVRAHVFLCMLACCVEWHMRGMPAPILFDGDDPEAARAQRTASGPCPPTSRPPP